MKIENKKSVMVVEDDESLQKLIIDKLAENEIPAFGVTTGAQALSRVRSAPPGLIVLDIMLPGGMNGFDVLEQLKANPILKPIPVIVLTNLDTQQKTALDIGAVDYIVKSNISLEEVILKIKNNLR